LKHIPHLFGPVAEGLDVRVESLASRWMIK
jgi:hypothetical protein